MKGSGKTTWARELVKRLRLAYPAVRVYLVDSKVQGDFDMFSGVKVASEIAPGVLSQPGELMVWQPSVDLVDEYDAFFNRILKHRQPAIVLIDELSSIGGKSGQSFPLGYMRLLKQGRGLEISIVTLTQDAAYIPRQVLGQASHLLRFRLNDEYDDKKADRILQRPRAEWGTQPTGQYGFLYRRVDRPSPVLEYRNWQEYFRER
jgi:Cdc6-like AAA superfamily ATPase